MFCTSFSCNPMPRSGCPAFHGVSPSSKRKAMEKPRIPSISNYKDDKINDSLNKALIYFENYPQIFWKSPLNYNRKKKGSPYYSSFTFRENNSSKIKKLIKNLTRLSLSKFYHEYEQILPKYSYSYWHHYNECHLIWYIEKFLSKK